jgi:TolB-like protein
MVLPFRVTGADPRLAYLREGMVDLLTAKLTGNGGPRAVDPRSVLSAWRRAGGSVQDDVPEAAASAIARRLGAGRLLEGSVVGAPARLVFTASIVSASGEHAAPSATLEGPLDSLSALVDRLTARLLAGETRETEKLADLTSTSLPALRAYLDGRAAYRQAHYLDAVQQFGRALDLDSTFALAGLGLHSAASWTQANRESDRGLALAWAGQGRLSPRDRLFLVAAAGPRYPASSSFAERLRAWERVVEAAPDQPEAQYELADHLFHYGPAFDAEDSQVRAGRAFERALELDSTFTAPLEHLIELAAIAHDTARLRTLSRLYLARSPGADDALYVRWRVAGAVGDSTERKAIRSHFRGLAEHQLYSIAQIGQYDGVAMNDVRIAVELMRQRAVTSDERGVAVANAMATALNEGRPASADSDARASRSDEPADVPNWSLDMRVLAALYWQADASSAAEAVAMLGVPEPAPRKRGEVNASNLLDLCIAELWRSARHEAKDLGQTVERIAAGSASGEVGYRERLCAVLLDVSASREDGEAITRKLERLDSLVLARGENGMLLTALVQAANLELARRWAARGDFARALRALQRRAYFAWDLVFLSTALRERARIVARAGDRAAAIRAYRHYLALRFDPEPSQRADVEQARAELAGLLAEGS